ncbi:hypothetical protein GCM10020218_044020 [Dactylosporangium vinaceum]
MERDRLPARLGRAVARPNPVRALHQVAAASPRGRDRSDPAGVSRNAFVEGREGAE